MYSLGLEFSTQSVKYVLLDVEKGEVLYADSLDYDRTFPAYNTDGGVLPSGNLSVRHTSPLMALEALGLVFARLKEEMGDLGSVAAIKADAMQHCTVYTDGSFPERLKSLESEASLHDQLEPVFTRRTCPIWEDRSPVDEVLYLTETLKSGDGVEYITGNCSELRFPGAQIMKWAKESPEAYKGTSHIFLLSSFISSVLCGNIAPVDTGDGWGTNLNNCDIENPGWSDEALAAADKYINSYSSGTSISEKIGGMVHYDSPLGKINSYFSEKYGVNRDAVVLAGTGDNPATLLGCGGRVTISLGSSYTVNGVMRNIVPSENGEFNVFGYTPGNAMALSVISNGAKVHDFFLRNYLLKETDRDIEARDWAEYIKMAGPSQLRQDEKLMLPYLLNESVPVRKTGIIRDGFTANDPSENIRSLHISQVLSLRAHSSHLDKVNDICIVGGASKNIFLRQLISDLYNSRTYTIQNADYAAPMGCAISGARFLLDISYDEAAERFVQVDHSTVLMPIKGNVNEGALLVKRYNDLENDYS